MGKILVVGSSNTDMVVKTSNFPEPGETIIGGDFFMFPGGKGANQAVAAARLSGDVCFVTRIGTDVFGDQSLSGFKVEEIDTSFIIRDHEYPSGVALITVNENGENEIVVAPGANAELSKDNITNALSAIKDADIILTQLECPLETVEYLIDQAKVYDKKVILNPAPAQELSSTSYENLYCITPNETEAYLLTGIKVTNIDEADQAASELLSKGVHHVIITMGASGSFYKSEKDCFFIKAHKVDAIDTTAAGDVFNGALAVGLSKNQSWRASIEFATKAAGISVTRMGAQASAPNKIDLE